VVEVLSKIPIQVDRIGKDELKRQILRIAIIAELDAISLYEQLASMTDDDSLRKVLLDVAREEKTHVGEFLELLKRIDSEQEEELKKGKAEVEEIVGH